MVYLLAPAGWASFAVTADCSVFTCLYIGGLSNPFFTFLNNSFLQGNVTGGALNFGSATVDEAVEFLRVSSVTIGE